MKVSVDETCIGCGLCPQICPEVFELNDANLAIVKINPVPENLQSAVRESATSCPVEAIHVEE